LLDFTLQLGAISFGTLECFRFFSSHRVPASMYSLDFRKLALSILKREGSYRRAAAICNVSASTLHRWATRGIENKNGSKGRPVKLSNIVKVALQRFLEANPVTTLRRMQSFLKSNACVGQPRIGMFALRSLLKRMHVSRKRTAKRTGDNKAGSLARQVYTHTFTDNVRDCLLTQSEHKPVVSLDECYFSEKVLPLYGYSAVGKPCTVTSPKSSWRQRSLLLAVASDGSMYHRLFDGSIDAVRFRDFVHEMPYPREARLLLDNAATHKTTAVRNEFEAKGYHPHFTPPYSPQYNPVENVFSKVKASFRAAWPWIDGVDAAVSSAVRSVTAADVTATFRHLLNLLLETTNLTH
jgi:transposase